MKKEEEKLLFELIKLLGYAYFSLALFRNNNTVAIARIQIDAARENLEKYIREAR